jgi:hypothetical protein
MKMRPCVLVISVATCLGADAGAGVVFSQGVVSDSGLVGRGWFSHSEPRVNRNFKHGDEFVLGSDAAVGSVRWWGLSEGRFRADLGNFDAFTVEFFLGVDGPGGLLPGALVASTELSLADTAPVATGRLNPANGAIEYAHTALLDAPVVLEAGVVYFLSVSARSVNGSRDGWMWSDADGVDRYSASYSWASGAWTGFTDTDSAFELISVPAPGGAAALGVGGCCLLRRRRAGRGSGRA